MEYADNTKELVDLNEGGCSSREAVHWTNNDCQWFTESAFVDGYVSTFIFIHSYFGCCPYVFFTPTYNLHFQCKANCNSIMI